MTRRSKPTNQVLKKVFTRHETIIQLANHSKEPKAKRTQYAKTAPSYLCLDANISTQYWQAGRQTRASRTRALNAWKHRHTTDQAAAALNSKGQKRPDTASYNKEKNRIHKLTKPPKRISCALHVGKQHEARMILILASCFILLRWSNRRKSKKSPLDLR